MSATVTGVEALRGVRRPGARILLLFFWLNVPALYWAGRLAGAPDAALVAGVGAALCLLPTLAVLGAGRLDAGVRMMMALTAMCFPALFLFLLQNQLLQMDMHMYFFAALAALTVLLDRPAILAAAVVTALHHLILSRFAPSWVFAGGGDMPRVMLHAFVLLLQTVMLLWIVERLTALILNKAQEAHVNETLRVEADDARGRAEEALLALERTQASAERQRVAEQAMRAAEEAAARRRQVADALEARLGAILDDLGRMAGQLSTSKERLLHLLEQTAARSDGLRLSHIRADSDVRAVAADTERLVASIHEVGANAGQARRTAREGADATGALLPKMEALSNTVDAASEILAMISRIAAQSRMLSFNAAIEAARESGDAQGFAIVAAEMKSLAAQTADATHQIGRQLEDMRGAAQSVAGAIAAASRSVASIDRSAVSIAEEVEQQIFSTTEIAAASEQMARHIAHAAQEAEALNRAVAEARAAMDQTDAAASAVSGRSLELNETVRNVLAELRTA